MEGSVYQRKDGRWVGVVDIPTAPGEKRKQKYVYGKTKKETTIKLNDLLYEIQNNIYRDAGNTAFSSFLDEWYKQNIDSWEVTTQALYKMYLTKHIKPILGGYKLKEILPLHITDFKNKKLKESSPNTILKYLAILHKAFDFACKNGLILINPVDNVDKPKKIKYKPNIYNQEQFQRLLEHVKGTDDEIPILLAGACGLRRGEIFGLRWQDVDFSNETITIAETRVYYDKDLKKEPKNEFSSRTIKVPKYILPVLARYKSEQKIINLYEQNIITRWLPQSYSERFKHLLERFEMPIIRLHDLRHYNAVIMMMYGIPDKVAAQRMGHSNTRTLREVYQHVLPNMDEIAARKINEGLIENGIQ